MPSPHEFLLFRLWGPMSSWGSIAVGEHRQTWARPSRSAVLGIVAAALGIERANAAAHQPLEAGLGFAVRVDDGGWAMRDYHTAQAPSSEANRRWRSRHDEIHGSKALNTILFEHWQHFPGTVAPPQCHDGIHAGVIAALGQNCVECLRSMDLVMAGSPAAVRL